MQEQSTFITKFINTRWFFLVGIVVTFLVHAPFLNRPPEGNHVWRQAHTLSMARNFYEEGMNPFKPKVDNRRMVEDGVTGSQFPAYEIVVAFVYQVVGEQFWVHRLWSFVLYLLGAFGMYLLFKELFERDLGASLAFWGYLWSPLLFYHGFTALPDILALPASIWGLYFFLKWWKWPTDAKTTTSKSLFFLASLACTTLGGLTKLQFLATGFFIGGLVLVNWNTLKFRQWLSLFFYALVAVGVSLGWYAYAMHLIKTSKLAEFGLEIRPVDTFGEAISILTSNLISDLPEVLLNYAGFVLLLVGIYSYHKKEKKNTSYRWPLLLWILGLAIYHIVELSQMEYHAYYMMPYIPVLLLFVGLGGEYLLEKKWLGILALLLLAQPVLATIRILPNEWMHESKKVPKELYNEDSRQRLIDMVPKGASCIVGIDPSNCIYFYYLNKKGYGISYRNELLTKEPWGQLKIDYYTGSGAEYIYLDDSSVFNRPEIQRNIDHVVGTEGRFIVAKLKKKAKNQNK